MVYASMTIHAPCAFLSGRSPRFNDSCRTYVSSGAGIDRWLCRIGAGSADPQAGRSQDGRGDLWGARSSTTAGTQAGTARDALRAPGGFLARAIGSESAAGPGLEGRAAGTSARAKQFQRRERRASPRPAELEARPFGMGRAEANQTIPVRCGTHPHTPLSFVYPSRAQGGCAERVEDVGPREYPEGARSVAGSVL